jgi:hypothetical protein
MLVQVEMRTAAELLPNQARELRNLPVTVTVSFAAGDSTVSVECGIAHLRRVSATSCEFGLGFRAFLGDGAASLERLCTTAAAARAD